MSDASRTRLVYRLESAYAESPPANAATKFIRFNSESLGHKNASVVSDEIRSDRQRADLILVGLSSEGAIVHEPAYGGFIEEALQAALCGAWSSDILRNGTTNRSFTIEKGFIDLGKYLRIPGAVLDKLDLDITARQIVKMTTSWKGAPAVAGSTSMAGSTAPTVVSTNPVLRAGPTIALADAGTSNHELVGVSAKAIKFSIQNNLRDHDLATSFTSDDFGRGVMEITGTLETYFKDIDIYQDFVANEIFALRFTMKDPLLSTNNAYQFTFPVLKLQDAPLEIPGVDGDVMQNLSFRALLDPAVGYSMEVVRNVDL